MADVLGVGFTHYPMLLGPDAAMAGLLRRTLQDPDIPAEEKDPANWSSLAREEWGDDFGASAASGHRAALRDGFTRCRRAIDEFRPDVIVMWGDDQYENFREEVIPPFCVLAYPDLELDPFAIVTQKLHIPNAWGLSDGQRFTMRGDRDFGKQLTTALINEGIDVAYSYEPRADSAFPHAFANGQIFLDYDHVGKDFPYPIVPIAVNCYGEHVIARRGGMARFAEINAGEDLDPVGPTPARCFQFGREVAKALRAIDKRVVLSASSSWSHAFLNQKAWHLFPDTEADQRLYDAMVKQDWDVWISRTGHDIVEAGQHEMLNWFCFLGAMAELGLGLEWSDFVVTEVFNSNKAFALFR